MTDSIKTVAIVGAGLVGSGWAVVFAKAGCRVRLYDPQPEIAQKFPIWAGETLEKMRSIGLIEDVAAILARCTICATLADALQDADYVQESVFERVDVKQAVSLEMDALIGDKTIVGSSSSGIPASQFTEKCRHRHHFLIAHPVNPPHLVPVVELVPAPWTEAETLEKVRSFMAQVEQVPVTVNKEIDGFILNRLQGALLNEAFALYEEGYASLADIDATISHGLGLRWSFMGPFETIDLNAPGGLADYAARLGTMYYELARVRQAKPWPETVVKRADAERRQTLAQADLAARRAWRDDILMQLLHFKQKL